MKKLILFTLTAFVLMSVFHPGLTTAQDSPGAVIGNAAIMTATIEAQVRRVPEQWVWMHRRWRRQPPEDAPTPYTPPY